MGLLEKLNAKASPLGEVAEVFVGLQTSADDVFILDLVKKTSGGLVLRSEALGHDVEIEETYVHPLVSGTDVKRYAPLSERQFIIFPYKVDPEVALIPMSTLREDAPFTAAYLTVNRQRLVDRERGRMRGKDWQGYLYLKNMKRQARPKICVPRLVERLSATADSAGQFYLDNVDVNGIVWRREFSRHSELYLLGLLNSRLLDWNFQQVSAPFRGGYKSANKQFLSPLAIRIIDFSNADDEAKHDRIVELVTSRMQSGRELEGARTDAERQLLLRQVAATDEEIDRAIYQLYDLSDDDVKMVESTLSLGERPPSVP